MTDKEKVAFANCVLNLIPENEGGNTPLRFIGTLAKAQGIKGFKTADIGTPVFEDDYRYVIVLESLDGKTSVTVPFYKESLGKVINFSEIYG